MNIIKRTGRQSVNVTLALVAPVIYPSLPLLAIVVYYRWPVIKTAWLAITSLMQTQDWMFLFAILSILVVVCKLIDRIPVVRGSE
ncbi:hypothetical protein A3I40_01745 [Candidatus Uhrbacteria bacterium RIFCSPLOWO2_02_FULL_48_12]|uniref:Uncharacterized protein n=1 Tax=Candidatus Uhrbacteria bacterium RIFCSPLOWO2_02_FULL_48_12 TaxID=1802407 RepID=A0A1F7V6S3_9BACT|nr:MAG: hypothetical protein A3I40_01745 [Candidatus Uhrbacteria bacterium RIFCSPLOWO2_02_FULL_48_12]